MVSFKWIQWLKSKFKQIILRKTIKQYERQIENIQLTTSFKIEALEDALIRSKLKSNTEREQL